MGEESCWEPTGWLVFRLFLSSKKRKNPYFWMNRVSVEIHYPIWTDGHLNIEVNKNWWTGDPRTLCSEEHIPGRRRLGEVAPGEACWGRTAGTARRAPGTCRSPPGCGNRGERAPSAAAGNKTCWRWPDAESGWGDKEGITVFYADGKSVESFFFWTPQRRLFSFVCLFVS